jgi:hypothetical protein
MQVTLKQRAEVAASLKAKPIGRLDPALPILVAEGYCPTCGGSAAAFDDEASFAEYRISGMCQVCQNRTFGSAEGEDREVPTDPADFV